MDGVFDGVGWVVLPGVDEEAVEAAEGGEEKCGGKEGWAEVRVAGYCGDEDGGGEADAYGDLFGEAWGGFGFGGVVEWDVDEDEVAEDQTSQDEIEVDGFRGNAWEEDGQGEGGEEDSCEEDGSVAMVEVMTGFEVGGRGGLGVEEAVGGVERPDSDGHREDRGDG